MHYALMHGECQIVRSTRHQLTGNKEEYMIDLLSEMFDD